MFLKQRGGWCNMKIVIVSLTFYPNVGGLEKMMGGLAEEWALQGHEVTVFTDTDGYSNESFPYTILRKQSILIFFRKVAKADFLLEANISLKTFLVGLIFKRKWFVSHHLTYNHDAGWKGTIKRWITTFSSNISCSRYVSKTLVSTGVVIPNFLDNLFASIDTIEKKIDFVFVGRLVSDKGVDLLIEAFKGIIEQGYHSKLLIIGDGPEKNTLQAYTTEHSLNDCIEFTGNLYGIELVHRLNSCKVLVIPSRWDEPFGMVALEGLACGCHIIASNGGGLPEAAGSFGHYFPNNNLLALQLAMENFLKNPSQFNSLKDELEAYLNSRKRNVIAAQYLQYCSKGILPIV